MILLTNSARIDKSYYIINGGSTTLSGLHLALPRSQLGGAEGAVSQPVVWLMILPPLQVALVASLAYLTSGTVFLGGLLISAIETSPHLQVRPYDSSMALHLAKAESKFTTTANGELSVMTCGT